MPSIPNVLLGVLCHAGQIRNEKYHHIKMRNLCHAEKSFQPEVWLLTLTGFPGVFSVTRCSRSDVSQLVSECLMFSRLNLCDSGEWGCLLETWLMWLWWVRMGIVYWWRLQKFRLSWCLDPKCHFRYPQIGCFGPFPGTENGILGARIKILRPLFNTN